MPDSDAVRQQRRRDRLAGRLQPVAPCPTCGKAAKGRGAPLCSRCWLHTDAGREWQRARVQAYRLRRRVT